VEGGGGTFYFTCVKFFTPIGSFMWDPDTSLFIWEW